MKKIEFKDYAETLEEAESMLHEMFAVGAEFGLVRASALKGGNWVMQAYFPRGGHLGDMPSGFTEVALHPAMLKLMTYPPK